MTVIVSLVTGVLTHPDAVLVSWQVTISLSFKKVEVKVSELVPESFPFTIHLYTGFVPPFVMEAVKVAFNPKQKALFDLEETIEIVGAILAITDSVMVLLEAVEPD